MDEPTFGPCSKLSLRLPPGCAEPQPSRTRDFAPALVNPCAPLRFAPVSPCLTLAPSSAVALALPLSSLARPSRSGQERRACEDGAQGSSLDRVGGGLREWLSDFESRARDAVRASVQEGSCYQMILFRFHLPPSFYYGKYEFFGSCSWRVAGGRSETQ